jgi:hypothetical protein
MTAEAIANLLGLSIGSRESILSFMGTSPASLDAPDYTRPIVAKDPRIHAIHAIDAIDAGRLV